MRRAVERDRELLQTLADEAATITPDRDPKLRVLADALVEIAERAEREATDAADEVQKRKVLVFSFFEDTVAVDSGFPERRSQHATGIGALSRPYGGCQRLR